MNAILFPELGLASIEARLFLESVEVTEVGMDEFEAATAELLAPDWSLQ